MRVWRLGMPAHRRSPLPPLTAAGRRRSLCLDLLMSPSLCFLDEEGFNGSTQPLLGSITPCCFLFSLSLSR